MLWEIKSSLNSGRQLFASTKKNNSNLFLLMKNGLLLCPAASLSPCKWAITHFSAPQMWRCLTLTRRVSSCTWRHSSRCFPKAFPWKPSRRWRRCHGRQPRPASPGWRQRSTTRSRRSSASPSRLDTQTHVVSVLLPCDVVTAHCFGFFFCNFLRRKSWIY